MDIALKTLILIVFILIPGFLFRRTYYQGGFSKQFDSKSWSHSIFYSVLFGLLLNVLTIFIFHNYYTQISFGGCKIFYDEITDDTIPVIKYTNFITVLKYLLGLYGASFFVAYAFFEVVRSFRLDRFFEVLRFTNHWHYYFKGEIKDFKEFSLSKGKCSIVNVDVLVKRDKDTDDNLYTGLLSSYSICNTTGSLEAIYLTETKKLERLTGTYKDINSTVFIIPNSNILNINLNYTFSDEDTTTVDFITVWFFLIGTFYLWYDPILFFSPYNLISKILLKLLLNLAFLLMILGVSDIMRLIVFDGKNQPIPANSSPAEITRINTSNNAKNDKKRIIKKGISNSFNGFYVFGFFSAIIIWFTKYYL